MSGVDYARRHGLNSNTFAWWRSELGRARVESPRGLTLVPVTVPAAASAAEPIEVVLREDLVVRVPDQADLARVAQLVRALVGTC